MIRHIVVFQFDKEKAVNTDIEAIKTELEALVNDIPALISMEVGINVNPNEKQHLVLTADVNNMDDLEIYARHPKHLAVAAKIKAIATGRSCVDYKL